MNKQNLHIYNSVAYHQHLYVMIALVMKREHSADEYWPQYVKRGTVTQMAQSEYER